LKDANGNIIGYAHSRKIFVTMSREQAQQQQNNFAPVKRASRKSKVVARKAVHKTVARRKAA